ncbi:MAG TPA: PH domain-containing protein [Terriglobia bacterium]|nr:PH domain-containing protein [Terriglobia bacterium]
MGYIENNLISGETITYRARLHWILFLKPGLLSLVFVAIAAVLFYYAYQDSAPEYTTRMEQVGAVLIVAALIPLIAAAVRRSAPEYVITNKRVIMKTGLVQNQTEEMFLNKIESIGVDQSVSGRMLGYGTIVIRGTGGSWEPFVRVSAPLEFRRQIQEQIGKSLEPRV